MTSYVPPKKNVAFTCYTALHAQATGLLQTNPTLAAGDVQVSKDGGAFQDLATLPDVYPAGGRVVRVRLSADEMNADNVTIAFADAAGAEWDDQIIYLQTSARQVDDLALEANVLSNATWTDAKAGYLDAAVSSRLAAASYTTPPTVDAITDQVWDEALADHLDAGSVGHKLDSLCCILGSGSVNYAYTVTDGDTGAALPNVGVTVTTDLVGTVIVAAATTNAFGQCSFWLDPGTYYFWLSKVGYQFTNPDTEVVV